MFVRYANLGMMCFWLFLAVVLLGGLMPDVLKARVGDFRGKLGGALAIGLAVYNFARWWSYPTAARQIRQPNPLSVRKIDPAADYNSDLDFNRPAGNEVPPKT